MPAITDLQSVFIGGFKKFNMNIFWHALIKFFLDNLFIFRYIPDTFYMIFELDYCDDNDLPSLSISANFK